MIVFIFSWETDFQSKVTGSLEDIGSWAQQDSNISLTTSKGEEGSLLWAEDEETHPKGVRQLPGHQGLFHYDMKW